MKKILLIALGAVALLLDSCTKDNNEITDPVSPITGLEMPVSSAEKPVAAGEVVSINGKGFTDSDEIWFSTATKASDEVKAEGFALTETGISFTAPAIDGEASLTLKQNGKVHLLGKMFFSTKSPLQEHFYGVFLEQFMPGKEDDYSQEFRQYDPSTNTFKPALTIPDDSEKRFVGFDNSNLYYLKLISVSDKYELCRYNVKENTVTSTGKSMAIWETMLLALTIDNQTYSLIPDYERTWRIVPIAGDGKGIAVNTFKLPWDETRDPRINEAIYNPASKSILLIVRHEENGEDGLISKKTLVSLSVETGVVTITEHSIPSNGELHIAMDNKGILLFAVNHFDLYSPDYYQKFNVIITRLDPVTLKQQAEVEKFTSVCSFKSSVYVASNNMMLSTGYHRPVVDDSRVDEYNAWSYDLTAKTLKQVNNSSGCVLVFKMLY